MGDPKREAAMAKAREEAGLGPDEIARVVAHDASSEVSSVLLVGSQVGLRREIAMWGAVVGQILDRVSTGIAGASVKAGISLNEAEAREMVSQRIIDAARRVFDDREGDRKSFSKFFGPHET